MKRYIWIIAALAAVISAAAAVAVFLTKRARYDENIEYLEYDCNDPVIGPENEADESEEEEKYNIE